MPDYKPHLDAPFAESAAAENAAEYKRRNMEMNLAWQFVASTGVSVFLTGNAGTGKTTFLRKLRELSPKRMAVLAPTGVAAINAGGQTIHSFFQLPLGPFVPDPEARRDQKGRFKMAQSKKDLIRSLDLLVIDEVSMVRADLLDQIDDAMRQYRDRYKPFGGAQLLLIGDLMQLAPVVKASDWAILEKYYDTPYFFSSRALRQLQYVTVELKRIYRQQDQEFISILADVRSGRMSEETVRKLNSRYMPGFEPNGDGWIHLTTHNLTANSYNDSRLEALPSPMRTFEAAISGDFPELNYPTDRTLRLKAGAQVMFVKNDPSAAKAYYNGRIGSIVSMSESIIKVRCQDTGDILDVTAVEWENTKYELDQQTKEIKETVAGTFAQFPLRLAWAITVHKSQGLTFDRAALDISRSFTHGQAYVALSRCRSLQGLALTSPVEASSVITDRTVDDYIGQQSAAMEQSASQLPELKHQYMLSLLDELYSFADIERDYRWLTRVVSEHLAGRAPRLLSSLEAAEEPIARELAGVAAAFTRQYTAALSQPGATIESCQLGSRIKSSGRYFIDKMRSIFDPPFSLSAVNIENKRIAETYNSALDALRFSLKCKLLTFEGIEAEGFTVSGYLDIKAKAALSSAGDTRQANGAYRKAKAKKGKEPKEDKPKAPKRAKGDSARETMALYAQGLSPEAIAERRKLAIGTVYAHLGEFVKTGALDLSELVTPEQQRMIRDAAASFHGSYTYSEVRAKLPADINLGQVGLTLRLGNKEF